MALLLHVPYEEKDIVKKLGAWWNPEIKRWYVRDKKDYPKFRKWITDKQEFTIVCDYIYIVEGKQSCYRCGESTRVIGFGVENYFEFVDTNDDEESYYYEEGEIHIVSHFEPMPQRLLEYVQKQYNYKMRYSKTISDSYMANGCDHCDALQGDFFLFGEVGSPFWVDSKEVASQLKLYRIPLKYDLVLDFMEVGWGSEDWLIKKYGKITEINL